MVQFVNRAKVATATTGTGTLTLGAAQAGYQTFADAGVVDGDVVRYTIEDGANWEIGLGTYTASGTTLSRTAIESSNSDSALNLSGDAVVFVTAAGADIQQPPSEGAFVDGDKTKLDGIAAGAQVNVATNLTYTTAASTGTVNSSTGTNATLPAATTSLAGLLTGADKTKLDGVATGATANTGTVTSVAASAGTGISISGSPITTSGTITVTNTAPHIATNLGYTTAASNGTVTSSTGTNATLPAATTSLAGLLTGADKTKLDGIAAGAQVNVATNLTYTTAASTGTVNSSTGTNVTLPAATTSLAGLLTGADKTKLNGIAAGAQVNVATNLSWTAGTTAGPRVNSSTGTNAVIPSASATASGAVTTGTQTFAGAKTFSSAVTLSTAGTATTHAVRADRTITSGTGILGGGNLTANRTLSIDIASQAEAEAGTDNAHVMTPLRVRNALNATGSAPTYACRAWVNFNGTGTVAIRASGNVSSITDNGTGSYAVNFTTAMPDANLSVQATSTVGFGGTAQIARCDGISTTGCNLATVTTGATGGDSAAVFVAIFR
jgi:hypothetical protein